jgi:hypothetical protein
MKTLHEKLTAVDWSKVTDRQAYTAQAAYRQKVDVWKQAQAALKRAAYEAEVAAEIENLRSARAELAALIADYRTVCSAGETETKWLEALSVLVDETTDSALRKRYEVSTDCVYQWRRRGLVLLRSDFSPNLRSQMMTRLTRPSNWKVTHMAKRRRLEDL